MRPPLITLLLLATIATAHAQPVPSIEPDQALTPGELAEDREAVVCQRGYAASI